MQAFWDICESAEILPTPDKSIQAECSNAALFSFMLSKSLTPGGLRLVRRGKGTGTRATVIARCRELASFISYHIISCSCQNGLIRRPTTLQPHAQGKYTGLRLHSLHSLFTQFSLLQQHVPSHVGSAGGEVRMRLARRRLWVYTVIALPFLVWWYSHWPVLKGQREPGRALPGSTSTIQTAAAVPHLMERFRPATDTVTPTPSVALSWAELLQAAGPPAPPGAVKAPDVVSHSPPVERLQRPMDGRGLPGAVCEKGRCYAKVSAKVSWKKAEAFCVDHGGHLASVHSDAENVLVGRVVGCCTGNYWIGLHKGNGHWQWTDGTPVDYFHWAAGEPNNWKKLNENYVSVWPREQRWNDDTNKGEGVRYSVCQWTQSSAAL